MEENNYINIDAEKTGKFIAELRAKHGLTQEELAKRIFISRKSVSKWETGHATPSIDMIKRLSIALGVSVDELILGEFIEPPEQTPVRKIISSRKFMISIITVIVLVLTFFIGFFVYNYNATKIYNINYEDENFAISNGVIVLSNFRNYINIGNFYSSIPDTDDSTVYAFELYTIDNNDTSKTIANFTTDIIHREYNGVNELLVNSIKDNIKNLYLKITFVDNKGDSQIYDIKLKVDLDFMSNFKNIIVRDKTDNLLEENLEEPIVEDTTKTEEKDDIIIEEINIDFLYEYDFTELHERLDNTTLKYNNNTYKIEFDKTGILYFISDEVEIIIYLNQNKINVVSEVTITIYISKDLYVEFREENLSYYKTLEALFNKAKETLLV